MDNRPKPQLALVPGLRGLAEAGVPHTDEYYAGAVPLPDGGLEYPNMVPGQPVYSAAAMNQPIAARLGLPAQILGFPADRVLIGAVLALALAYYLSTRKG